MNTTLLNPPAIDTSTVPLSSLGLDYDIPEWVFLIRDAKSGMHWCQWLVGHENEAGLKAFANLAHAREFARGSKLIPARRRIFERVTFDEARAVAQSKPPAVIAVVLFDMSNNSSVHYVR